MPMDFNRIITELCWRLENGTPDFSNPEHLQELRVVLTMHKWTTPAINELIETLTEERTYVDNSQNRGLGRVGKPYGSSPEDSPKKSKDEPEKKDPDDNTEKPDKITKLKKAISNISSMDKESRITSKEVRSEMETDAKEDSKRGKEVREALASVDTLEGSMKEKAVLLMAIGQTYGARDNAGFGKNNFGMGDRDQLNLNKENLLELYGDGDPKTVEKGVRAIRKNKVTEEFVSESFDTLPPKLQSYLKGAGDGGKNVGNGHFLGYEKEDGTTTSDVNDPNIKKDDNDKPLIVRGRVGNEARAKVIWRVYLEQGGVCAYTGMPLDIESMDLEHAVGLNNTDDGDPKQHYDDRENDANFLITSSRANQQKSDLSMKSFFETKVDPLKNKSKEDFEAMESGVKKVNTMQPRTEQTALRLMEEVQFDIQGGSDTISQSEYEALPDDQKPKINLTNLGTPKISSANLGKNVTRKSLQAEFDFEEAEFESTRNTLKEQLIDKKDKKKASAIESKIGKRVINAMGLAGNIAAEGGRRTSTIAGDNFYKGFALAIASAPPKERQKYKTAWQEARTFVNKRDANGNLVNGKFNGKNQKDEFVKFIRDKVKMPSEVLEDPKYKSLWSFE